MNTQQMIERIAAYLKTQPVLKAWLFGSFARGEETKDSDVDLLIVPDTSLPFTPLVLKKMREELQALLNREVDIITVDDMYPSTRRRAEHEAVLIYKSSNDHTPDLLSDGAVQVTLQEEASCAQEIKQGAEEIH